MLLLPSVLLPSFLLPAFPSSFFPFTVYYKQDEFPRFFLEICRQFEDDEAFDLVLENLHNAVEMVFREEAARETWNDLVRVYIISYYCILLHITFELGGIVLNVLHSSTVFTLSSESLHTLHITNITLLIYVIYSFFLLSYTVASITPPFLSSSGRFAFSFSLRPLF